MKRSEFFKAIGVFAITPSVLLPTTVSGDVAPSFATQYFKDNPDKLVHTKPLLKRYPIFPDVVVSHSPNKYGMETSIFYYVKINRANGEYLVPVRETGMGETLNIRHRFHHNINLVEKNYEVSEWMVEDGFVLKYNKNIHNP